MQRTKPIKLSQQISEHSDKPLPLQQEHDGNTEKTISTGSTLLDLAITGGRVKGGGIPGGILVEIFGPSGSGKTILLCEIAGNVQRQGGQVLFRDPEARLNKQYAELFGLEANKIEYDNPDTIAEVFAPIRKWSPEPEDKIHGIFADSLTALTTEMEMEDKDQYGMRRAKEFSEEMRKTCRILAKNNFLMVCSNQIRQNLDSGPYGQKYKSPGGEAMGFYSSLRLKCNHPKKITKKQTMGKEEISRTIGVETEIEVFKSSVWKPYHTAPVYVLFDYGIDDIRANLKYIKEYRGHSTYRLGEADFGKSLTNAIHEIEETGLEEALKKETIKLWEEIESKFEQRRKQKQRC